MARLPARFSQEFFLRGAGRWLKPQTLQRNFLAAAETRKRLLNNFCCPFLVQNCSVAEAIIV
jgi:hypothetical protein